MSLLSFLKKKTEPSSAGQAKERLQIIVARSRPGTSGYDFLPQLQQEIMAIVAKYVGVSSDDIKITVDNSGGVDVLDVTVQVPQANG